MTPDLFCLPLNCLVHSLIGLMPIFNKYIYDMMYMALYINLLNVCVIWCIMICMIKYDKVYDAYDMMFLWYM